MLRKLMKYEFRATGRMMLPLFLLVLITSVGANLSTQILLKIENRVLNILGMLLLTAFILALVGVCIVAFILMIERFYKNLLQDEGYVMMTLPISTHQHVWSKLLVSMVWFVATALVLVVAVMISIYEVGFGTQIVQSIGEVLKAICLSNQAIHIITAGVELLGLMLVSCAGVCLQFYAAMAIGHSFANHKMIVSILVYFGSQFVIQLFGSGLLWVIHETGIRHIFTQMLPEISGIITGQFMLITCTVVAVIFVAMFYFLTIYFLKRHLNLE